ncbi:MAG: general secretion pathway protein GspB [Candidatus Omnitrophica bacterium]|nr:general secretion pathway protein GspB [Candidatus Omnitrophota bacterium]
MSIINEALNKAQNEVRNPATGPVAPRPPAARPVNSAPQPSRGKKRKLLFLALSLFPLALAGFLIRQGVVSKITPISAAGGTMSGGNDTSGGVLPSSPKLRLNGIVYDSQRPYAIVNNKVLSKGDMIEGACLVEINPESVKFKFEDREIELR